MRLSMKEIIENMVDELSRAEDILREIKSKRKIEDGEYDEVIDELLDDISRDVERYYDNKDEDIA